MFLIPKLISFKFTELTNATLQSTSTLAPTTAIKKKASPGATRTIPTSHPLYTNSQPSTVTTEQTIVSTNESGKSFNKSNYGFSKISDAKSKNYPNAGAAVGITLCVLFFLLLISLLVVFMYRRHTAGGGIFNYFRRSSAQMRFEVLNENDEM